MSVGGDGRTRCSWAESEAMRAYHDEEWGRPVTDERGLYERLTLEAFQSGLSWSTILGKREGFRRAFFQFDPERVARFRERDVARLLADAGIVRNRAKIEAAIANAKAVVETRSEPGGFAGLVWSFAPEPGPAAESLEDLPAATEESKSLAEALKARGFRFVGPTTAYALMEAAGLVNDHLRECFVREAVAAEQAEARAGIPAGAR